MRSQNRAFRVLTVRRQPRGRVDRKDQRRLGACSIGGKLVDVLDGPRDRTGDSTTKSGAEDRVEDYIGSKNIGFDRFIGSFVGNVDNLAAEIAPALQVCGCVAVQFIWIRE